MIISASRRTDIPAFYSDWFMNRIKEGFVLVRNPFNAHQISKISLSPDAVDCIVFWTKNPANLMNKLTVLDRLNYHYYFQFTLTPYEKELETNLPDKQDLVSTFIKLSNMIGKERLVWRYDPILLTDCLDRKYHYKQFQAFAEELTPYADRCVISFVHFYSKSTRNLKGLNVERTDDATRREIAANFMNTCRACGLRLETCAEEIDLTDLGLANGKCIDDRRIARILGRELVVKKAQGQRKKCGCVSSIDIGAYNSCAHNCLYCYANSNSGLVKANCALHDPESPLLLGQLRDDDRIAVKEMGHCLPVQDTMSF
jgi:hypothetical protein